MSANRLMAIVSSIAVALVVGVGLYLGGTPAEQRLYRLDERRVNHLNQLSFAVQRRWNSDGSLPQSLEALVDGQLMSKLPVDPETGAEYGYEITSENQYRLCAVFSRPGRGDTGGDFWAHEAGYQCFSFTAHDRENDRAFPSVRLY